MAKPTEDELRDLYIKQRISPEDIGARFGFSGRTVREWLKLCGIPRLGPAHLRKGKSATWNLGIVHSSERRRKNREAKLGNIPHNKGAGHIGFDCEICGAPVFDKPYRRKRTCSKKCKDELMRIYRGDEHWNFKGDDAANLQRKRFWVEYREWRMLVISGSNYTCAKCRVVGGKIVAHHIEPFSKFPDLRFSPSNGAALCKTCHISFHKTYGYKRCSKADYLEWITTN